MRMILEDEVLAGQQVFRPAQTLACSEFSTPSFLVGVSHRSLFSPKLGKDDHLSVSLPAQHFEELVADGAADDELVVRVALARRGINDPLRAMHEA